MAELKQQEQPLTNGTSHNNVRTLNNFIDGKFVPPTSNKYLTKIHPARNQPSALVARSTDEDVELAVKAAAKAFPQWSALTHEQRSDLLMKVANRIEERSEELARLESEDTGKPVKLSRVVDIPRAVSNFKFFCGAVRHDETGFHAMGEYINYTQRYPVGVAGLITPWNLPIYLLTWKVAPALIMGNTVIAKPSELTPSTATALASIFQEVGIPNGVFNVVHGLGGEAGNALVAHPDVSIISFTGGTVTGRHVARTAAPLFKKLSLELGGKNATVVFADCDFDKTVEGVWRAAFTNQGQVCLCGSRIFIERPLYDRFVQALVKRTESMLNKIGDPLTADFGSLVSVQHREKIESYVQLAREDSRAQILVGGKRPSHLPAEFSQGAFYEPTIIAGLPADHRVAVEEIFGPVVTVHPFEDEAEITRYVNLTKYGLAGSIWTTNLHVAHRLSQNWTTGMVWVNCWLHRDLRVPFGGVRESGTGTEGGKYSLEFYSNTKNICLHIPQLPQTQFTARA